MPSSTRPSRLTTPASNSSASWSEVLPAAAVADQRDVANPVGGLVRHGHGPYVNVAGFNLSDLRRERRRRTAFEWSWETRDSVTPSTSPISRRVRFSK